ncbi:MULTISPECIES: type VI secretion system ATPase TssH [Marinobacter]|uniref:Type VI secretion system ATPase TssH n=2 Tax=Marinobacter TaxID=2742 RepID=A0A351PMG1_9GAMM|nr:MULTISPECIES: type VI secretion system ATPase TssH [Marinobacter]MAM51143.1 type VI secretion system ATPase TssH [Marinobacter sp.]MCP4064291.1 type VI secretion system ATPase TssH [Gammaproteobacteria bacterium]HAP54211.1 type VI secretion system ATPase TssH [Marinobacter adhaerens]AKV96081.1 ATPase AAA [Marinobacter sp. CP1]EHJ03275.1 ATPase [Marinobacter manganoxydans MnI7-9]
MIRVELPALIGRLNDMSRQALEASAALCISRQGAEITPAHLLFKLLETPFSDVRQILEHTGIDHQQLQPLVGDSLNGEVQSAEPYPSFSPLLVELMQDAWLLASTELGHTELRSGAVFLALLMNADRYLMPRVAQALADINREQLRKQFDRFTEGSAERLEPSEQEPGQPVASADLDPLKRYATDFTGLAREEKLDPVVCRDAEIDQMIDILCRRRKNNPIVVGDAGVGKSAVVEGLALRIVNGDVPDRLRNVELWTLDMGALQAGASVKGEFEKRLKGVIEAVKGSATPIILFIDEAHTLIGAGNSEGGSDAANLLKPALARGELRTIAATTWREYKKYFEKDPALSRRFQPVALDEPTPGEAVHILRGLRTVYEKAHQVLIADSALKAAAEMSARYLAGRQLPDKAIDVLDTACARVSLNLSMPPRRLSHVRSELHQLAMEQNLLSREHTLGQTVDADRERELEQRIAGITAESAALEQRWNDQRELVARLVEIREQLLTGESQAEADTSELTDGDTEERPDLKSEAAAIEQELTELHADEPLVHARVDARQVAEVIADWTGIPVNRMTTDELEKITHLPAYLQEHIKGQDTAIDCLHQHLLTARADLRRPGRPMGAFLLVGPSGVGKTETVVQLAELLYGGRQFLTTINMSEYQEKHTVSRLIGSPPGYVGFGEGGILTEAIRQKPYSVVLLDEVEKAHPEVLNLFYQAFDKGELADGEGRLIDCKNVVFFLTSNLGYQTIVNHAESPASLDEALYPELASFFKPALLARMEVVPYLPLGEETLNRIVGDKLQRLADQIKARYHTEVELQDGLIDAIRSRATRSENGARMLESIIEGELLPPVSLALLEKLAARESVTKVMLGVEDARFTGMVV